MIVRTLLAVALAAALVAASMPAIESAGREHTASVIANEVDRFVDRATSLVDTDDAVARPGARRIVTVRVPEATRTSAGLEDLAFEPGAGGPSRSVGVSAGGVSWKLIDGDRNRRVLERIALVTDDGAPLVLSEPGRHRLVLSLRGSNAAPRVHVRRYDARGEVRG